jgi:hypothetical protein
MRKHFGWAALAVLAATLACAEATAAAGGLEYKDGAICDRKSGFCADHQGVSLGITRMYLGAAAETRLMAEINKVGLNDFDAGTFTMRGGLTCKVVEKTCWTSKFGDKVDSRATRVLFGSPAGRP